MAFGQSLVPEFDQEMALTRKVIARVPDDKGDWKPHPKSFSLAHLAQLVSSMPGWFTTMVTATELDLAKSPGYSVQTTETLLATFDKLVPEARAAIAAATDNDFAASWSLKHGGHVLYTATRRQVVRETINHLVHHRAQLTVYLRLLDVPVPSMYGPTADEPWGAQG
jgi:uncharacterized damage-inducible protein DinB